MKISVFGLGYVGAVSAGCLTATGHEVTGVDPACVKVDLINGGKSPVIEEHLDELIGQAVRNGRLKATQDIQDAILSTDLSLVCVGTPSKPNGDLDLRHVATVSREIGEAISMKGARHTVVIRSTVLPGTVRGLVIPLLEKTSGKQAGSGFGVGNNPEFLREGTAVADFFHPPKTVIGAIDTQTSDDIAALYSDLSAPLIRTSIEVGEMVKYCDNAWHALKVAFANEIGTTCKAIGIDSHAVMDIFCKDTKLNLSPTYLKPGFAFGGSCLPKDVRALAYRARYLDLDLPVLNSILQSNERQINRGFDLIAARGKRAVSFLGVSFKAGTDDLRESPILDLVERLIGKGYDVRIFDKNVNLVAASVNIFLAAILVLKASRALPRPAVSAVSTRKLVGEAWPLLLDSVVLFGLANFGLWVVGSMLSPEQVAIYGMSLRLVTLVSMPTQIANSILPPLMSHLYSQRRLQELENVVRKTTTLIAAVMLLVLLPLALYGGPALAILFGPAYREGGPVIAYLALGQAAMVVAGSSGFLLIMTSHQRTAAAISTSATVLYVPVAVMATKYCGAAGAAFAFMCVMIAMKCAQVLVARARVGIWTQLDIRDLSPSNLKKLTWEVIDGKREVHIEPTPSQARNG